MSNETNATKEPTACKWCDPESPATNHTICDACLERLYPEE